MDSDKIYSALNFLIGLSAVTLIAIVSFSYKVVRFINRTEMKIDLMWQDYEYRMRLYQIAKQHNSEIP